VAGSRAVFGASKGCSRSSREEAESGVEWLRTSRKSAEKRATPGVSTLGVACQLVDRTIRSRSQGSPRATLIELLAKNLLRR
jgi:hypothetical protein